MDVQDFKKQVPRTGRAPIVRIDGELSGIGKVIYREQELGVRNPEVVL